MPRASSNQIASRGASVALVTTLCLLFPGGMPSADPHGAFTGLLQSVNNARAGSGDDKGGTTAKDFYISDVEPVVQDRCVVCHQQGLTADQQGARSCSPMTPTPTMTRWKPSLPLMAWARTGCWARS